MLTKKIRFLHPLVKILAVCIVLEFMAVVFYMVHYSVISKNSHGVLPLAHAAEVIEGMARGLFMVLLILIGKGWTLTAYPLKGKGFIIAIISLFLLIHFFVLLWKYQLADPAAVKLQTPLQIILSFELVAWFLFCAFFSYSTYSTYTKEENPMKKKFFLAMMIVYIPWFGLYPFIKLLDMTGALGPVHRVMVVAVFRTIIAFIGYVILSFLTWPSRASAYVEVDFNQNDNTDTATIHGQQGGQTSTPISLSTLPTK